MSPNVMLLYSLQAAIWRTCHANEAQRYVVCAALLLLSSWCLLLPGSAFAHCQSGLKHSAEVANHLCHQKLRWISLWKLRWILTNQSFQSRMISWSNNRKKLKVYSTINHVSCNSYMYIYLFIGLFLHPVYHAVWYYRLVLAGVTSSELSSSETFSVLLSSDLWSK